MIVSHNEILTTVRQALEALGVPQGQGEDAADMVAWRELHGLPAVEPLARQMQAGQLVGGEMVKLVEATAAGAIFNGRNRSALVAGPPVVDWAYTAARQRGLSTVVLRRCVDPALLMGYIVRCAGRGVWARLRWGLITGHQAEFAAGPEGGPVYGYAVERPTLVLTVSQLEINLRLEKPAGSPENLTLVTPAAEFRRRQNRRGSHGIAVTDSAWRYLKKAARGVLVPASERSRRGAGE